MKSVKDLIHFMCIGCSEKGRGNAVSVSINLLCFLSTVRIVLCCVRLLQVILVIKSNKMHYFSNLFDKALYMFWSCPLSIIRSISTLYTHKRYLSC